MTPKRILVADDEKDIREVLREILTHEGYEVEQAAHGQDAIEKLSKRHYNLLLADLKMPHATGIEVLRYIREQKLPTISIIATAHGSIDSAIEAMKLGAREYLTKPFHPDEIRITVRKALEFQELELENINLRRQVRSESQFENIIGDSAAMRHLFSLLQVVSSDADSTVLITGESGTGKELIARAIHYNSPRRGKPLIPVNCGALPETLLESELFGHVRGAFTGAHVDRVGRFQLADGGTIFLDEIGEMSPMLQVKVLRVLQEQEFEPVGSTTTVKVNVRVLAATNRDLEQMVEERKFREDLFFRVNVIPIHIPPLRERIEDVEKLLVHFLHVFNQQKGKKISGFSDEAIQCLCNYTWKGNVRELENLCERLVTLNDEGRIELAQLPEKFKKGGGAPPAGFAPLAEFPADGLDLNQLVENFETHLINQALAKAGGVKNRAAKLLNIKRTTLVEKMKKIAASHPEAFAAFAKTDL